MADEQDVIDEIEAVEVEETEADDVTEQPETEEAPADDDGLVVEIGGDDDDDEAPEWVKNVRRENRELKKKLKAFETGEVVTQPSQLPPEPELADFDYDDAAFKAAHKEWVKKSLEHEREQEQVKELQAKAQQRWEAKLSTYEEGKGKIGAPDFDDAEATVSEIFAKPFPGMNIADIRMGIIKQGAKDPTTLVYALGRNPEKAKALAEIDDPVEFAFALGRMEGGMKIVRNTKAPAPEKRVTGGMAPGVTATNDRTLDRLRAQAEKTGDYTEVVAYKRKLKG